MPHPWCGARCSRGRSIGRKLRPPTASAGLLGGRWGAYARNWPEIPVTTSIVETLRRCRSAILRIVVLRAFTRVVISPLRLSGPEGHELSHDASAAADRLQRPRDLNQRARLAADHSHCWMTLRVTNFPQSTMSTGSPQGDHPHPG
jgi:hypothetical protein